jgi:hypothetical protein
MNIFFTCKNTLVIALQLYRLYVVYAEKRSTEKKNSKQNSKKNKKSSGRREQSPDLALVLAALESSGAASKYAIDLQSAPKASKKGDPRGLSYRVLRYFSTYLYNLLDNN